MQILGNLQVEGTQTTINSTTLTINDKNLVLADSAANAAAAANSAAFSGDKLQFEPAQPLHEFKVLCTVGTAVLRTFPSTDIL